jgi:hypothetical protein
MTSKKQKACDKGRIFNDRSSEYFTVIAGKVGALYGQKVFLN